MSYIWRAGLTYKTVKDCLFKLAFNFFLSNKKSMLSRGERLLLLAKNLQCKSWDRVAEIVGMSEEKCKEKLMEIIEKIILEFYGDRDEVFEFQKEVQRIAQEREKGSDS